MKSLEEWNFEFSVSAVEPIPYEMMDHMLWHEAIPWAEKRELGIGGGFRNATRQGTNPDRLWHFGFGLCIQKDDLLIPRSQAQELFDMLVDWCQAQGFRVNGGFREYTPDELGLSD